MDIQIKIHIDDRLVRFARRVLTRRVLIAVACLAAAGTTAGIYASTVTLHTFTPGTTISAAQVNENFQALQSAIAAVPDLPTTCPSGQVAASTGSGWACSVMCSYGTGDCNGLRNDGCEASIFTSPDNCGACGAVCSGNNVFARSCSNGVCNGVCSPGFADCDENRQTNGCEVNRATDPNNCSSCGLICSSNHMATRTCGGGVCNGACAAGFADCNNNKATDGCEVDLATTGGTCP